MHQKIHQANQALQFPKIKNILRCCGCLFFTFHRLYVVCPIIRVCTYSTVLESYCIHTEEYHYKSIACMIKDNIEKISLL